MKLIWTSWVVGVFLLASAWAGTDDGAGSSGGGDNVADDTGAAWFLRQDRVIQACFEISSSFGLDSRLAKSEIEDAFKVWREYIGRKFQFADIKPGISTLVTVASKCKGTEDLVFFLGTWTEEVKLAKTKYNNPTAFAFKRSYSPETQWGQGWIWFAPPASVFPKENFPDWTPQSAIPGSELEKKQPWVFRAILLHEIGHVLGNAHVPGTIMSERISENLRAGFRWNMDRIDQARELMVCWQCAYEWNGDLAIYGSSEDPAQVRRENFKILTGHVPKTDWIGAKVRADGFYQGTVLEVFDQFEKFEFPIEFSQDPLSVINRTLVEDSTLIFKRMLPGGFLAEKVQGMIAYGSLTNSNGERMTLIMERNLPVSERSSHTLTPILDAFSRGDYRLKMIYRGQVRPLFEASWFYLVSEPVSLPQPIVIPPKLQNK